MPATYVQVSISECVHRGLTQLEQPAFTVRVEEGVGEVTAIILGNGEGFAFDAVKQVLLKRRKRMVSVHLERGLDHLCWVAFGRSTHSWVILVKLSPSPQVTGALLLLWPHPDP